MTDSLRKRCKKHLLLKANLLLRVEEGEVRQVLELLERIEVLESTVERLDKVLTEAQIENADLQEAVDAANTKPEQSVETSKG